MIFVTVGTHYLGFERLVKKMDEIAAEIDDEVIIQVGHTDYEPQNAKWFKFKDQTLINELYNNADIIVAHAGAGSLLDSLSYEKPLIIVPRLKKFDEHIDDQQLELAEALESSGKALAVYDIGELDQSIRKAVKRERTIFYADKDLNNYLKNFIGD